MNIARLGNTIYKAVRNSPTACETIRAELETLAVLLSTDPNASARITSATVNGQTFSTAAAMTNTQRLALLGWVVECIDAGGRISTSQIVDFG